jgi:hypothetical protein
MDVVVTKGVGGGGVGLKEHKKTQSQT